MLSWATEETSPIFCCARVAGPSILRANERFSAASVGSHARPTSARNGSAAISDTIAKAMSRITPAANGTG